MKFTILKYSFIDFSKIHYDPPSNIDNHYKLLKISYKISSEYSIPVLIESPRLRLLGDLKNINGEEYIDLAVDKKDTEFISFISNIDKTHIDAISRQSNAWFGKEWTKNAVDSLYTSVLSLHKDIGFVIRVRIDTQSISGNIFNSYKEPVKIDEIHKGDKIRIILFCSGIKFFKNSSIPIFEVKQLKHIVGHPCKNMNALHNYFIQNEEDSYKNILDSGEDEDIEFDDYNTDKGSLESADKCCSEGVDKCCAEGADKFCAEGADKCCAEGADKCCAEGADRGVTALLEGWHGC